MNLPPQVHRIPGAHVGRNPELNHQSSFVEETQVLRTLRLLGAFLRPSRSSGEWLEVRMVLGATPLRVVPDVAAAVPELQAEPAVPSPRRSPATGAVQRPALRRLAPGAAAVVLAAGGLTQLSGITAAAAAEAHGPAGGTATQTSTSGAPSGMAVVTLQWVTPTSTPSSDPSATTTTTPASPASPAAVVSDPTGGATGSAPSPAAATTSSPTSGAAAGSTTTASGATPTGSDPGVGGSTAGTAAQAAVALSPNVSPSVSIAVTNNAAGTGYGSSETASATSRNVPYRVVVTNPNSASGKITVLTDTVNGNTMNICPDLAGASLAPGVAATCDFTGPVPTKATTLSAAVTLSVGSALAKGTGTTTVFPPTASAANTTPTTATPTAPVVVTPSPATPSAVSATGAANPSLARTGAPVKNLVIWMALLLVSGLCILAGLELTDQRRRLVPLLATSSGGDGLPRPRSVGGARGPSPATLWQSGHRWQTGWWSPATLGSPGRVSGSGWPSSGPPPAPPDLPPPSTQ